MRKLYVILVLTLLSCGGSKEFDEVPTPIGGDDEIRSVFHKALGKEYFDLSGVSVRFSIRINKNGAIEEVGLSKRTKKEFVNRTIVYALKEQIRFTPAIDDGQKVKANFEYEFIF